MLTFDLNMNIFIMAKVKVKSLSCVRLFATPWTVAYQAPPSMGFFRQEYWSGLLFLSPRDLSNLGIEPRSPPMQADTLPSREVIMAKTNIKNRSKDSQPTEKSCLPFSGPQEFPVGWSVCFPSLC